MTIELPLIEVFGRGGALKSSWYGDCLPSRDFPMLIDLYLQGRFDLDAFVSETIGLDDVEAAFEKMHHGEVLRSVVVLLEVSRRAIEQGSSVSGVFSLDGQDFDVDNNVWLVGDDDEVLVIDAPHDAAPIVDGDRRTAGDRDRAHPRAQRPHHRRGRPARGHRRADLVQPGRPDALGRRPPGRRPDQDLAEGTPVRRRRDDARRASRTPGHSPGSTCLYAADLGTVFTGDTLFCGGPGATGRSYSDHPTIVESIRARLLTLPGDTVVRTGHGDDTTIAAEAANVS